MNNPLNEGSPTHAEFCVTETPDDPSLNPLWVGEAESALDALNRYVATLGYATPYEELPVEPGDSEWYGVDSETGATWATLENTTIYALPVGGHDA